MAWESVDSSWVMAVDYRPEEARLYVRFKDKSGNPTATGYYDNVDPALGLGLLSAPSKGVYIHRYFFKKRHFTVTSGG